MSPLDQPSSSRSSMSIAFSWTKRTLLWRDSRNSSAASWSSAAPSSGDGASTSSVGTAAKCSSSFSSWISRSRSRRACLLCRISCRSALPTMSKSSLRMFSLSRRSGNASMRAPTRKARSACSRCLDCRCAARPAPRGSCARSGSAPTRVPAIAAASRTGQRRRPPASARAARSRNGRPGIVGLHVRVFHASTPLRSPGERKPGFRASMRQYVTRPQASVHHEFSPESIFFSFSSSDGYVCIERGIVEDGRRWVAPACLSQRKTLLMTEAL